MENYGRPDPQTGLNTRVADFLRCLDQVVDYAIAQEADLVIFAGDAFRTREPTPTHQREFARRIRHLVSAGIPVVLIVGNHDISSLPAKADALDIYATLEVPGVWVGRQPELKRIETRSGPLQVAFLPWIPRWAQQDLDYSVLVESLAGQIDPAIPAVLAAHCAVEGATLSSEARMMAGSEPTVAPEILANRAFEYVALGHVHRFQDMNRGRHPPVVYSGSLERVDFSEEGEDKGFVCAQVEKGRTEYEFVPVCARRFLTIEVQVEAADSTDATGEVLSAIAQHEDEIEGAVVRVRAVLGERATVDDAAVRRALAPAFWAGFTKEVRRAALPRSPNLTEHLTDPLLALEEYIKTRKFSEQRAKDLREYAARLVVEMHEPAEQPVLSQEGDK
jgi:exonuclease SbcD